MLINSLDYTLEANFLPLDIEAYSHVVRSTWALSHWTAAWGEVPVMHLSIPERAGPSGVGDVLLGWAGIIHEDLERRFTTSVGGVELTAPTGDVEDGTGSGRWVLTPLAAIALNPTDLFPIYVTGRYSHSLGGNEGEPVNTLELNVETAHILPKGFYVSAIPTFYFDFEHDTNFFSIAVGVGRALTKKFAWGAGYIQHVVGTQTFSRGFTCSLNFIWGDEKLADP